MKKLFRKDGKVNMCKALEDMREDARQEGKDELLSMIICKKIQQNRTLDMIVEDLGLDIDVIRPIYETSVSQLESQQ